MFPDGLRTRARIGGCDDAEVDDAEVDDGIAINTFFRSGGLLPAPEAGFSTNRRGFGRPLLPRKPLYEDSLRASL